MRRALDGAILRLNPDTGAAAAGNPLSGSTDLNARRIIAYGVRNPFRFTIRPGTSEVWLGDVGWTNWEEINRIQDPLGTVENFGWPCYEGAGRQGGYDGANLNICENLYAAGPAQSSRRTTRTTTQRRSSPARAARGRLLDRGSRLLSGRELPERVRRRALLRRLLAEVHLGHVPRRQRAPRPGNRATFATQAPVVDLQIGPDGDLFYVDYDGGSIRRIRPGTPPPPTPPGSSPPTRSTRALGRLPRMRPGAGTPGRSAPPPGRAKAASATRSASTGRTRG